MTGQPAQDRVEDEDRGPREVKSKEEAVAWASRCPASPGQMLELRQVFEASDFGEAMTPELEAAEERLRAEGEARSKQS